MARWCLILAGIFTLSFPCLAGDDKPAKVKIDLPAGDLILGPEVVRDQDGTIRLARSVLLSHGLGATDFHQGEALSDKQWAKTVFQLDSTEVADAELFIFGSAKEVVVNGKAMPGGERLKSTGWSHVKVPTSILKKGANEFVFRGGGHLLVEPGRPGHSGKSTDGGRTWARDNLTGTGDQAGEYVVRLRLERFAARGWVMSAPLDLWQARTGANTLTTPFETVKLTLGLAETGPGTAMKLAQRAGNTPTPDDKEWTAWQEAGTEAAPGKRRWVQFKFELASSDPQKTPRLPAQVPLTLEMLGTTSAGNPRVESSRKEPVRRTFLPFAYQGPSARLELLRKRYKLDDVIAPGKTELEQLMLLRYWVRNQWHTAWGNHPSQWMPPWDALIILEAKDQPDCLTMCTHYAAVFTQCCQALGWSARHCILDHHCVAEVYYQDADKWVMMDAGNSAQRADVGLHFERKGVPLSARELHLAHKSTKVDGIMVHFTPRLLADKIAPLCRPAPKPAKEARPDVIPLAELGKYPVCQLDNFRRYAFPARNNFLSTLVPGELYQGWSEYFYDGYWWVGDSADQPTTSPEYSQHLDPNRPQDADWNLNWTRIHLAQTLAKPGETQVHLETMTPGFARFEKKDPGKEGWQKVPPAFLWQLVPGRNELTIRSVNLWGKTGTAETVTVERK